MQLLFFNTDLSRHWVLMYVVSLLASIWHVVKLSASWRPEDQLLLFLIPWATFHSSSTTPPWAQRGGPWNSLTTFDHTQAYVDKQSHTLTVIVHNKVKENNKDSLALIKYECGKSSNMTDDWLADSDVTKMGCFPYTWFSILLNLTNPNRVMLNTYFTNCFLMNSWYSIRNT